MKEPTVERSLLNVTSVVNVLGEKDILRNINEHTVERNHLIVTSAVNVLIKQEI